MRTKLYYAAVALVLAASVVIFAARSAKHQSVGFILHQKGYQFDDKGGEHLNYTSEVYYNSTGSYYEVKHYVGGMLHRDLKSAEDGAWYRVTKERVYRRGEYSPRAGEQIQGDAIEIAGVAAVRLQPKDDRTGRQYTVADFAPGLQNALVGLQSFGADGLPTGRIETVSVEYTNPPAELFKLPAGVPVESVPPPFEQKQP